MGRKGSSVQSFLMLCFILASASFISISNEVGAIGDPTVQVTLDQDMQTINLLEDLDNTVTFTGKVQVQTPYLPPGQYLIVILETDAGDWPVTSPGSFRFDNEVTEISFDIDVRVPYDASHETPGQLLLSGRWRYSPGIAGGEIDPVTAVIKVEQYFDYDVVPYDEVAFAEEKCTTDVIFTVYNEGNGRDIIALEVVNQADLDRSGIEAVPSLVDVVVPEKWSVNYPIEFTCKPGTDTGIYEVEVLVYSTTAESLGNKCPIKSTVGYVEVLNEGAIPDPRSELDGNEADGSGKNRYDYGTLEAENDDEDVSSMTIIAMGVALAIFVALVTGLILFFSNRKK